MSGPGGMGVVYRARQPQLNRLVALKILAPEQEKEAAFAERFTREAQALARLSHQNIVTIYDFGKVEGLFYLLMEYVDGVSLRQLLQTKKITPEEALAIVPKICDALQYAHEHGVVHRDIKPDNVLLNKEGQVKIADFGIAKMVGGDRPQQSITRDAQVIGTPHYMAPEQVEHPQQVDHRADIYSLGVVFYEMLTGELPLGKFAPPSSRMRGMQVDVRLDEVVLKALEKEPARRYQQISEVKTDVETIAREPHRTSPVAAPEELARELAIHIRRRQWRLRYGFIGSLIGFPVGIIMDLPYVWGLSICGIVLGGFKLGLFGSRPNNSRGPPKAGQGSSAQRLPILLILMASAFALGAVWFFAFELGRSEAAWAQTGATLRPLTRLLVGAGRVCRATGVFILPPLLLTIVASMTWWIWLAVDTAGRVLAVNWRQRGGGLYRFATNRWTQLRSDRTLRDVAVDPRNSRRLMVVSCDDPYHDETFATGVWTSEDDGSTWQQQNEGLPHLRGMCVSVSPHDPDLWIVGTGGRGFFMARWTDFSRSGQRTGNNRDN